MTVRYPEMRGRVRDAVEMIAHACDTDYWLHEKHYTSYPPSLCIEILYDVNVVFPDPEYLVGAAIYGDEVTAFKRLLVEYDPVVEAYDANDGAGHVRDPRWPAVEVAARDVLRQMSMNDRKRTP